MSIATRSGDDGSTNLMFNRRVPKTDLHIEACGGVDELSAALGVARAAAMDDFVTETLLAVQEDLIQLMGELATPREDLPRYEKAGFKRLAAGDLEKLDKAVAKVEALKITFKGWALPGDTPAGAALDMARAICRRAERGVCALRDAGHIDNLNILAYLNRLSDTLWLLARWTEAHPIAD